jgi:cobalt-zinc-cadmium efflux system protein
MDSERTARELLVISVILLIGTVFEYGGGVLFGSLALISDAYQMLVDGIAFFISYLAESRESEYLDEYGQYVNAFLLFPISGYIVWASYQRLMNPVAVQVAPTVAVGIIVIIIELALLYKLEGHKLDMNEKGGYYHLISDISGTVGVILGAVIIHFTGAYIADTIIALLFAGFMIRNGIQIIRKNHTE